MKVKFTSGVLKALAYGICVPVFLLLSVLYITDKISTDVKSNEDRSFMLQVRTEYPAFQSTADNDLIAAGKDICTDINADGVDSVYKLAGVSKLDTQALDVLIKASVKYYCPSPWTDLLSKESK